MRKILVFLFLALGLSGMAQNKKCKIDFDGIEIKGETVSKSEFSKCKKLFVVCDGQTKTPVESYELEIWIVGKGKAIQTCNSSVFNAQLIELLNPGDRFRIKSARVKSRPKESFNSGIYTIQ